METYKVIGIMSGTSLDGLDMACCNFRHGADWSFEMGAATTVPYPQDWEHRLRTSMDLDAEGLARLHTDFGRFIGKQVAQFAARAGFRPDLIASHGHTVFHRPQERFTLQVGDGNAIAAEAGIPVVYDFRSLDVALGGQGAPLVPIGDRLLFGNYGVCLNLGGIANLSFEHGSGRLAFDICPANMLLNFLAEKEGASYDRGGTVAASGRIDAGLLSRLNGLDYYRLTGTKTLGREWFLSAMVPLLSGSDLPARDLLRTAVEHIAVQVAAALPSGSKDRMLVTGGGAHNDFLMERIRDAAPCDVVVPDEALVDFKEALVFALLGVLRVRGDINCLATVTGATRDSSGGVVAGI